MHTIKRYAASPGDARDFPDLPVGKRDFHPDSTQNDGNVKKMAAFMQYWQVHHPQQPGVPTPKIQFFESKNKF